jgi:dipeptidyl aminopeptidase/acylaminoacyl peptidase
MRHSFFWAVLPAVPVSLAAAEPSFHRDVLPLLQKNCAGCHQPSMKSSGLDITTYAAFKAGGKRGAAFVAGSPDESITVKYMNGAMKPSMPLGQPALPEADVTIVREWIKAGAIDDTPAEATSTGPSVYVQPPVITALRFSPDGKQIAVSGNREILVHNVDGSGAPKRLAGKAERILSIAWSPDGSVLVAGGGTPARFGEVQFWDARAGKQLRTAELTNDTVFGASIAPDGSKVVVGCADNTVHGFDVKTAKELYKMSSHENWVLATVFGVDSKRFVSVGRDRAAKLVDANVGQFLENVNQMRGELAAVARHPKKDWIVVGGEERIPYVYLMDRPRNMKVGEESTLLLKLDRQDGAIFALDWSPDGNVIAVAGAAPNVSLHNAGTGARVAACGGHTAGIYAVQFSPDGKRLATGGFDGLIRIYSAADCKLERSFVPVPLSASSGGGLQ